MMKNNLFFLVIILSFNVFAQQLELETVVQSTRQHHPLITQELQSLMMAASSKEAADGAFDLNLVAKATDRQEGYYDGQYQEYKLQKAIPAFNTKLYTAFRSSDGKFPIYESQNETLAGGESSVGFMFSLLRERSIDDKRLKVIQAKVKNQQAKLKLEEVTIKTTYEATKAYWDWVAKGRIYDVNKRLLDVALKRNTGLKKRIKQGDLAKIYLTENAQYIAKRESEVLNSKLDLSVAAIKLSLFYRDAEGKTIIPAVTQLPKSVDQLAKQDYSLIAPEVLERSPLLGILNREIERINSEIENANNDLLPRLDVGMELAQDNGEGLENLQGQENKVFLKFEIPIERRLGRGKVNQSKARKKIVKAQTQYFTEVLSNHLLNLKLNLDTSRAVLVNTKREFELAQILEKAENKKFISGASDFFVVNLREEKTARAKIKYYKEVKEYNTLRASFEAARFGVFIK
jgi:hypothetical protein